MLPATTELRLRHQLEAVPLLLAGTTAAAAENRPAPGKWSARENLAHLARYHEVMSLRIERMQREDNPPLDRYKAEDDPAWPHWQALPLATVTAELSARRAALLAQVGALSPAGLARRGVHPVLGALPVALLLEFFLLHEAHHLYVALPLLRQPPAGA
jgi:hypothetical protein